MLVPTKSSIPKYNRPYITENKQCLWILQHEFRENEGLATLGILQSLLSIQKATSCSLNFQNVEWGDPQPLLCLGLVLAESDFKKNQITIDLGSTDINTSTPNHRIFLKFLAQQGFLNALGNYAQIICDKVTIDSQADIQKLRWRLAAEPQATHFLNADCIFARIIESSQFKKDELLLQETVEELVKEAHERAIESAFGAIPMARDILFQKLRKLLYELILNIAEHSHKEGMRTYAGVYARIRGPKPPLDYNANIWKNLFNRTLWTFGQSTFEPNQYAEWLELYVCDVGEGLTSDIENWQIPSDPEVAEDLKKAQNAYNPLESIAYRLFRNPLSRHVRHDSNRTAVTGLQHLGHLLGIGGDYCRIYTQKGCWVGGHLPWPPQGYSRKDIRDPKTSPKYAGLLPVTGTAYVFSIQPKHNNVSAYNEYWITIDAQAKAYILEKLRISKKDNSPKNYQQINQQGIALYDRRIRKDCLPPLDKEPPIELEGVVVLRPPRLTSKQDIAKWLALLAGSKYEKPKHSVKKFIIADLTPFQTLTFRELLLNVEVNEFAELELYLVTEHWAVCAMTVLADTNRFIQDNKKAQEFLTPSDLKESVTIADLAISLRKMDSEIFWQCNTSQSRPLPFFNAPVDWVMSDNKEVKISLQRYLDFAHALADPERYRACRRALRRCLALFVGYKAVPADDLVDSLVKDVNLNSYVGVSETKENKTVIVGSVAVTAGTVNLIKEEKNSESIQIMVHGENTAHDQTSWLAALLWLPDSNDLQSIPKPISVIPWRRIPNTPYIAPHGEKSISILRYKRKQEDNCYDFDKPLYGRTPEDTYKDFQRLGVLKTGHWKYGSRHDLLTINMRLAFRASFMELGPVYIWMQKQFRFFFKPEKNTPAKAQILIYPSHPVTDTMLDRIRQDSGFKDILPEGGMIPVKFLGTHTVSPLLASHLVEYQIREVIKNNDWSKWSAVIVDDAAVTGKHMRELDQFLRGLKPKKIYTIALLDRTGLPIQENIVEEFLEKHKRFWRWDVPDLGNARDCPLCQALAIAQTYANELPLDQQKKHLHKWIELWKAQDVESGWHHSGLKNIPFISPFPITFGVDETAKGSRKEKVINVNNSTAATSLILELTRLTARSDVALKKIKHIEALYSNGEVGEAYLDAAIEVIACQLLLFPDELTSRDKRERYIKLLDLIWSRSYSTTAMSLAGLCFTLVDHTLLDYDNLLGIWEYCRTVRLKNDVLRNYDAILAVYMLYSRLNLKKNNEEYKLHENASDVELENYVLLGLRKSSRVINIIGKFLKNVYMNPSNPHQFDVHSSETRKKLNELIDIKIENITPELVTHVIDNIKLLEKIVLDLNEEEIAKFTIGDKNQFQSLIDEFNSESKIVFEVNSFDKLQKLANDIFSFLYIDNNLVLKTANQFLLCLKTGDYDNNFINNTVISIRKDWEKVVASKERMQHNWANDKLWKNKDGSLIKPDILFSSDRNQLPIWLYYHASVRDVLKDTLLNVYHVSHEKQKQADEYENSNNNEFTPIKINDPWLRQDDSLLAHMWWEIKVEGDFAIVTIANMTENKDISLGPKSTITMLECFDGRIDCKVENNIAFTSVRIPLYSYFIKHKG